MKQDIIVDTNIIFNAINAIKEYKNNYDTNTIKLENVQSYLSTMCRIDYLNLINIFEEIFTAAQETLDAVKKAMGINYRDILKK